MLDLKRIREDPEAIEAALKKLDASISLKEILALDARRRKHQSEVDMLRMQLNATSKEIGQKKKAGDPATELVEAMAALRETIKTPL